MLVTAPTTHWFRTSRNSYMPESEPMSYKKHACFEPTFFKKCLAQKCFWVQVGARPWSFFFRVKQFIATPLQKRSNPLDSKWALPPGLLEPKVRHLQSQPALSAHQPQAAGLQPHARGAAGQRGRTHCGRPASAGSLAFSASRRPWTAARPAAAAPEPPRAGAWRKRRARRRPPAARPAHLRPALSRVESSAAKLTVGRCPSEYADGSHGISKAAELSQISGSRLKNLPPLALERRSPRRHMLRSRAFGSAGLLLAFSTSTQVKARPSKKTSCRPSACWTAWL